jgi:hypothetical protein
MFEITHIKSGFDLMCTNNRLMVTMTGLRRRSFVYPEYFMTN